MEMKKVIKFDLQVLMDDNTNPKSVHNILIDLVNTIGKLQNEENSMEDISGEYNDVLTHDLINEYLKANGRDYCDPVKTSLKEESKFSLDCGLLFDELPNDIQSLVKENISSLLNNESIDFVDEEYHYSIYIAEEKKDKKQQFIIEKHEPIELKNYIVKVEGEDGVQADIEYLKHNKYGNKIEHIEGSENLYLCYNVNDCEMELLDDVIFITQF
jgi:hypothetical protein